MLRFYTALLLFTTLLVNSQNNYAVSEIPSELKKNANAVIRLDETVVELKDFNEMVYCNRKVVTVFNKRGLNTVKSSISYDNSSSIKSIEAYAYNKNGKEIKRYKKRDFINVSASGGNLYTDDRLLYVDYTPTEYPFTFDFFYEKKSSSTVLLPPFFPVETSRVSAEKTVYTLTNEKAIPLAIRKFNLKKFKVKEQHSPTKQVFEVSNLTAIKFEPNGFVASEFLPIALIAPRKFQLVNTPGEVSNWEDFGHWQNEKLLKGIDKLPSQTVQKVNNLVSNLSSEREKIKAIYEFMQDRTRYISVQVGIGGWRPTSAEEVDRLGYGDCKGLTNYTKALLKTQGIESYYTLINASNTIYDIDEDFVAIQGNHAILTVPLEDETIFLECTSQKLPFNHLGPNTDNRKVIIMTPQGGKIIKTHEYTTEDNKRSLKATAMINSNLEVSGILEEASYGILYNSKYYLEDEKRDDVSNYYKNYWGHLNDLSVGNIEFNNNKKEVIFTESLNFGFSNYLSKAGDRILLNPNIFTRITSIPYSEEQRTNVLKVQRGTTLIDEIIITIPPEYKTSSLFDPIDVATTFGSYKVSVIKIDDTKLKYSRQFVRKPGAYPKEMYDDYVRFMKQVVRGDKSKIVLIKK